MTLLAAFLGGLIITYLVIALRRPRVSSDMRINRQRISACKEAPSVIMLAAAALVFFYFLFYRQYFAVALEPSRIKLIYPWPRPARVIPINDIEHVQIVHRSAAPGTRGYLVIQAYETEYSSAALFTFTEAAEVEKALSASLPNHLR